MLSPFGERSLQTKELTIKCSKENEEKVRENHLFIYEIQGLKLVESDTQVFFLYKYHGPKNKRCNTLRIHHSVVVGEGFKWNGDCFISNDCFIGNNVTVNNNTIIMNNVQIGSYVTLGENTYIGTSSFVQQRTIVENNNRIGERVKIGNQKPFINPSGNNHQRRYSDDDCDGMTLGFFSKSGKIQINMTRIEIAYFDNTKDEITIGPNNIISNDVMIDKGVKVGKNNFITQNTKICTSASIGDDNTLGREFYMPNFIEAKLLKMYDDNNEREKKLKIISEFDRFFERSGIETFTSTTTNKSYRLVIGEGAAIENNNFIENKVFIDSEAKIGCHNYIGPKVIIKSNSTIGKENRIEGYCLLDHNLRCNDKYIYPIFTGLYDGVEPVQKPRLVRPNN